MLEAAAIQLLLTAAGAAILSLLLTPLARSIMRRLGAVDQPGGRRVHTQPTPRGAGWAIIISALLAAWISGGEGNGLLRGLLAGLSVLVPVCIIDDIWGLPPLQRLVAQVVAATLAWKFGVRIEGVTNILSPLVGPHYIGLGYLSLPATVVWLVLMTNALNWLDGLDGLAAGVCAIASATVAYMAYCAGMTGVAVTAAAIAGACLGFLRYNFHPASVFMGDTGSMSLGLMLAAVSAAGAFKTAAAGSLLVPLLIGGLPLYDAITTMWGRWRRGQPLYIADRTHVHHRLLDRGLTVVQAVLLLYAATAALCVVAVLIWKS